ncbi:S-formylglutathione hydrolase [Zavarzinia sp.]|uniref:S-formylglutathione hydrolase n=1 Tax=Zavarzinia sp. TaxID=2027920 RepID=UPI003BB6BD9B
MTFETVELHKAHEGLQGVYRHASTATGGSMTFALYLPPQARAGKVPLVTYLSGLTCSHANVMDKGEYRKAAAEHGIAILCPDTSPRGEGVANDDAYDLGQGAGFYVDATQAPWAPHFNMWTYVTEELPALVAAHFPLDMNRQGITGHSMGGHGALTVALRHPGRFRSVSAFAPIVAPARVPWGRKAFPAYLGADPAKWRRHDAVALIEDGARLAEILVDQGTADNFLEGQLKPELLKAACDRAGIDLTLRLQEGYDHSYHFISTFMASHIGWHAMRLKS